MAQLLEQIKSYWSTRTEGYSEVNKKELEGMQRKAWLEVLQEHFPQKDKREIKILDIGTGPGFFTIILAEAGYQVTAVDYTEGMIQKAKENVQKEAGNLIERICFQRMDAQNLTFENESFDVVISRNLTWNLEEPEKAYREWIRVLKPGGVMMNFDANWYAYLYDEEKRQGYEQDRKNVENEQLDDHYLCTDIETMENIALQMPLSRISRPKWDMEILSQIGVEKAEMDTEIWKRVWSEECLNSGSTPMFVVCARKGQKK